MLVTGQVVGDNGAQQRLDGAEQRDGEGRGQQVGQVFRVEGQAVQLGQPLRNTTELAADGGQW
ncbi:hypothetical protein D3C78_1767410 [compost metagenome]